MVVRGASKVESVGALVKDWGSGSEQSKVFKRGSEVKNGRSLFETGFKDGRSGVKASKVVQGGSDVERRRSVVRCRGSRVERSVRVVEGAKVELGGSGTTKGPVTATMVPLLD